MADPAKNDTSNEGARSGGGISQFLTEILRQLNVSSWLPAAMFITNISIIYQLHRQPGTRLDIGGAIGSILETQWALFVALPLSLILAAMVVQAFAFESIRFLEGYWPYSPILAPVRRLMVGHQLRKYNRAHRRKRKWEKKAFKATRTALIQQLPPGVVMVLETQLYSPDRATNEFTESQIQEAGKYDWREFSPPYYVRQLDALDQLLDKYPEDDCRILPTTLGNVLRHYEDSLVANTASRLEDYVTGNLDRIPDIMLQQHDEHRTKLDMYCTMVFVFLSLGLAASTLHYHSPSATQLILLAVACYLLLACLSYMAAIASADAYGSTLRSIDSILTRNGQPDSN